MTSHPLYHTREWMYKRIDEDTGEIREEYKDGLRQFMEFITNQQIAREEGMSTCPCVKCGNEKFLKIDLVWRHLYHRGFTPAYYIWLSHGEDFADIVGTSRRRGRVEAGNTSTFENEGDTHFPAVDNVEQMVNDAYPEVIETSNVVEEPNPESRRFFEMLDAAKHPIYDGCKEGHSPLSAATRMMGIKTDFNLSEDCVDAIADFFCDYLPEDNLAPRSYYAIQKLVAGLGLPYQVIDVCRDNCMIFWREDANLIFCRFCGKERFQVSTGQTRIPFQRMWYLPITDRLKRLYQSERTAAAMRWHGEHPFTGDISHPSDAEAWKHFRFSYPDFASEMRNVYLGLCTDGFNPFGKGGRKYSLWPVIVTPYNLPSALCMKREFLFLTILVPGPNHPRRALDVFLQPLISELQMLWHEGVRVYDVSMKTNFTMRAVLMWTISDFPAYGMLSGWTTHGRLSCPHCQDNTGAFWLQNGKKSCWFDCHRRFLPANHAYRRNRRSFRSNKVVRDGPPPVYDGNYLLQLFSEFYVVATTECGGNGHDRIDGYGEQHNWHKKSIFWELPYWKDHLLRHNLDVMHIEKNFFDNIINTVLNVQGKTKDNLKSRLDLPGICGREELHVTDDGRGPVPIFRLSQSSKTAFFEWIQNSVKFPDGYVSNLSNCVDDTSGKFYGLKSHDCHVIMQRLLPFAFAELFSRENVHVHEAIAGTFLL